MADHLRAQIRGALVTALTGLATTGTRVYGSRVYPVSATSLPALRVYALSEFAEVGEVMAPRLLERRVRVQVQALAKAAADLDDTLDQICQEVEVALAMPCSALAGIAKTITLLATEIQLAGDAEQPVGMAAMTYEVFYMAAENAPDVAY